MTADARALLLLRCRLLESTADYCRDLAGPPLPPETRLLKVAELVEPDLPADLVALERDDQLRLYEHLERLAAAARDATHRLARHLHRLCQLNLHEGCELK